VSEQDTALERARLDAALRVIRRFGLGRAGWNPEAVYPILDEFAAVALRAAEARIRELEQHTGQCARCGKWTCGYCGIHNEHGEWICERCHGVGPLAAAEARIQQLEATLAAALGWRGFDGDGISDPVRSEIIAALDPAAREEEE
jgi:hypothetical protein